MVMQQLGSTHSSFAARDGQCSLYCALELANGGLLVSFRRDLACAYVCYVCERRHAGRLRGYCGEVQCGRWCLELRVACVAARWRDGAMAR